MADDMSDCPSASGMGTESPERSAYAAMNQLPTLQRNALRKIFDRLQFSPEEVAALGYRRLQQAEGIGAKGLSAIAAWLETHGQCLPQPAAPAAGLTAVPKKTRRTIEMAVRLLRTHGYEVQPKGEAASRAKSR